MSKSQRDKGQRVERKIVNLLREAGIFAERVPLSGASRYRDEGHDINVYAFGRRAAPLVFEVKARKEGAGFTLLKRWLGQHDGLVTREDRAEPLVTLPWRILLALLIEVRTASTRPGHKNGHAGVTSAAPARTGGQPDTQADTQLPMKGDTDVDFVEP